MLKRTKLYEANTTGTTLIAGDTYDLSSTSGHVVGATVTVTNHSAGTFTVVVQTSPDGTNWLTLASPAASTADGLTYVNTAYLIGAGGGTVTNQPADAFNYVRCTVTPSVGTPDADVEVNLVFATR